ncbi:MAG: hypothetical protein MOP48_115 [Nitrososphaera sp.]|nr:hypothetical protein [Nitrososphaera sp.]
MDTKIKTLKPCSYTVGVQENDPQKIKIIIPQMMCQKYVYAYAVQLLIAVSLSVSLV